MADNSKQTDKIKNFFISILYLCGLYSLYFSFQIFFLFTSKIDKNPTFSAPDTDYQEVAGFFPHRFPHLRANF